MASRAAIAASSSARAAGAPARALITTTGYHPCSSRALLLARAHAVSSARGDGLSLAKPAAVATTAAAAAAATMLAMPQAVHAASAPAVAAAAAAPLFILPPMTPGHIALLALASLNLLAGFSEGSGQNTPYSKFSPTQQQQQQQKKQDGGGVGGAAAPPAPRVVSSRDGMALIYVGGLVVSLLAPLVLPHLFALPAGAAAGATASALLSSAPTARPALVALLLALHFAKRELEVFFLHRYSGGMPLSTAVMISTVYTVTSLQYLYFAHATASSAAAAGGAFALSPSAAVVGVALFCVGQLGNLYHHWLLARLRSSASSSKAYIVPQGGLFGLVAAPHYLFEIVAWLGMALATQSVVPLVSACGMASYLAGRSASTLRWNRANIPGYPADRKSLVPFLW